MSNVHESQSTEPHATSGPSRGVRTTITLLLIVHLFGLVVAVTSNLGPVIGLRRRIRQVPLVMSYLQLLNMDLAQNVQGEANDVAYYYHLTYADEFDADHHWELALDYTGDWDGAKIVTLAGPHTGSMLDQWHYRNLGLNAARVQDNDAIGSLVPHAVAKRLLHEAGVTSGHHRIRLRHHAMLSRDRVGALEPAQGDPYDPSFFVDVYEADVKFAGDRLILSKAASAARTAPLKDQE